MFDANHSEEVSIGPLLAEYKALTLENAEYVRQQNRIVLLLSLLFCASLLLVLIDWRGLAALLAFPWISTLLVVIWSQQQARRLAVTSYISDRLEPPLSLFACTCRKIWSLKERRRFTPFRPGVRLSLPSVALSVQWFFIILDTVNALLLIGIIMFAPSAGRCSWAVLLLGLLANILLLSAKYWLLIYYPWEQHLSLAESSAPTVVKEGDREAYPRFRHAVEKAEELHIPPAAQSCAYTNLLYDHLLFIEQGTLEIRDGLATPQQRLDQRNQYVKICTAGDIARIPAGFTYIIANPSAQTTAFIRHRRLFAQELFVR